jgi:hypothetical protein
MSQNLQRHQELKDYRKKYKEHELYREILNDLSGNDLFTMLKDIFNDDEIDKLVPEYHKVIFFIYFH